VRRSIFSGVGCVQRTNSNPGKEIGALHAPDEDRFGGKVNAPENWPPGYNAIRKVTKT
jgi:hypothetical protein